MSYVIVNTKTKKEKNLLRQFVERMKLDYKEISLQDYLDQIEESRHQIRKGKTVSMKQLENGL